MKVPPASAYRSRIANEVASSVAVPKCIAPRLSTLTERLVFGAVTIVRYFMRGSSSSPVRPVRPGPEHQPRCWSALHVKSPNVTKQARPWVIMLPTRQMGQNDTDGVGKDERKNDDGRMLLLRRAGQPNGHRPPRKCPSCMDTM